VHAHFDLIAGTSVGAILGCAFAQGMTATEVRSMWLDAAQSASVASSMMSCRVSGGRL
jgi:predicted acylesterase/phospholipase RssA